MYINIPGKKLLPLALALLLYGLIYYIRLQQGGWEVKTEILSSFRGSLEQRSAQLLPYPQAQLLDGILLGDKKDLPGQLKLALRDTSTLHIVVVSGQNLTILGALFVNLAGLLKRKTAIILTLLLVYLYTILTGAQVPVLRAALMVSFSYLAELFGREADSLRALLLCGGLMLLVNPLWLGDLSFQLSFLATFGVIVVAPILEKALKKLPKFIAVDLAVTVGAQLMVTPVIIQNFHQLSLVSVITNLAVLWVIPWIMIFGGLMIFFSFLSLWLGWLLSAVVYALLTYFIYLVNFFSAVSFSWIYVGEMSWLIWIGYYLLLTAGLLTLSRLCYDYIDVKNEVRK